MILSPIELNFGKYLADKSTGICDKVCLSASVALEIYWMLDIGKIKDFWKGIEM